MRRRYLHTAFRVGPESQFTPPYAGDYGVYAADDDGNPQFQALLAPDDEEIAVLTASLAERIPKLLQRRGLGPDSDPHERMRMQARQGEAIK